MGYIFDFKDAKACEQWFDDPHNGFAVAMQNHLLLHLLKPYRGETILEIGCGTGSHLRPLIDKGMSVSGLDPSPYMLDISKKNLGHRVELHRGYAEALPFDDNAFNYACFITSLEFVEDPSKAIEEAARVAKDKLFVGVMNRYALKGIKRRIKGIWSESIYNRARFYSIWELKQILRTIVGDVPMVWRTVGQLPAVANPYIQRFEKSDFVQRCPFGAFAGVAATLTPRLKTRPLSLKYSGKHTVGPVAG